ncbi:MAG: hydratase [Alphaproteobacteria bacterium]|nr:hydratase [Alphaproteobacteria bacterium]
MNIALYGQRKNRWAMTERRAGALARDAASLTIGPSGLQWSGGELIATIKERGAPLPYAIRGTIRVTPETMTSASFDLDRAGQHHWQPYAPRARVEVVFTEPSLRWSGWGYMDRNFGSRRLEDDFDSWDWSRAHFGTRSAVLYNATGSNARPEPLALTIEQGGALDLFEAPRNHHLPKTLWRIDRQTQADSGQPAKVIRTLEDTPFYARSTIETSLLGRRCMAVHETLSLSRFSNPIVKAMLPFRMPRVFWR